MEERRSSQKEKLKLQNNTETWRKTEAVTQTGKQPSNSDELTSKGGRDHL